MTDGFRIVDSEIPEPYHCHNYHSILTPIAKSKMDSTIRKEILEGCISSVSKKPYCLYSLGAVTKGTNDIQPIKDCSRPPEDSINNYCSSLARKFSYSSLQDVVDLIKPGYYMSVLDILFAFRAVPVWQSHRQFLGFSWELDGQQQYYVDNRLCFHQTVAPYYFHIISCFIVDLLKNFMSILVVQYLDDYLVAAPTKSETICHQTTVIKTFRFLGFGENCSGQHQRNIPEDPLC